VVVVDDESNDLSNKSLSEPQKSVHNPEGREESVHNSAVAEDKVYTIRQVNIRGLRSGLSKELSDLPFEITKNGVVIATVVPKDPQPKVGKKKK